MKKIEFPYEEKWITIPIHPDTELASINYEGVDPSVKAVTWKTGYKMKCFVCKEEFIFYPNELNSHVCHGRPNVIDGKCWDIFPELPDHV